VTLTVRWRIESATISLFGPGPNQARVDGEIEYSGDGGGSWTTIDSWTKTAPAPDTPPLYPSDHETAPISLSPSSSTGSLKVRATLTVELTQCAPGFNITQVAGTMRVYDIRVVVAPPVLTASPNPVTRGELVTFEVKGAPGGEISNWAYDATAPPLV